MIIWLMPQNPEVLQKLFMNTLKKLKIVYWTQLCHFTVLPTVRLYLWTNVTIYIYRAKRQIATFKIFFSTIQCWNLVLHMKQNMSWQHCMSFRKLPEVSMKIKNHKKVLPLLQNLMLYSRLPHGIYTIRKSYLKMIRYLSSVTNLGVFFICNLWFNDDSCVI